MKEIDSNINIIGGGLIGSVTAYSLSKMGFNISILESKASYNENNYSDHRTTAISEGTKIFLNKIGVWKQIHPFCEPIKKIMVIDRNISNQLEFDNIRRKSNLGYIVQNKHLLKIFYNHLRNQKNITIFNNIQIKDFQIKKEKIITHSNTVKVTANLNIAADGKNSFVRDYFKLPYFFKDYKKNAFVTIFTHTKDHDGTAFEFFYKNGPLAILPMKKIKNNFCSSMVWTNNTRFVNNLFEIDQEALISILNKETQNCLGDIKKIITKQKFRLNAHINSKFFEKRLIYLGDSAHSFHPIAGQGWNLGMSDVESLYNLVLEYKSIGIEPGDSVFCKKYHNNNFYKAYRLYQVTDKLDNIFKITNPLIYLGRSTGIKLINKNIKLKHRISDFAMGIS